MDDFLRAQNWYPALKHYTFKSSFLPLNPAEIAALAAGEETSDTARKVIARLKPMLKEVPGNSFVSVDCCAPTDTERFAGKRGAVFSARSAWTFLARSAKVREAAAAGMATCICVRPFRRMNVPREFRLFIVDGKLAAASQYHLVRHFRRLDGVREEYWKVLENFVKKIADKLTVPEVAMDVYITSGRDILVIDLNQFGPPTMPLLLRSWDQDWAAIPEPKLKLMSPPVKISGEVKVSF
ncbi:MAG: hypothetical protein AB7F40_04695 [Victivallaceae bacterium]|nr:hypothetical protein [Victivallaceae bacterium]